MPPTPLRDLFEQYRADNQGESWRNRYKAVCSQIADIREERQHLTPDFVKQVWTARDFGPARISQGCFSGKDFDQAKDLLTDITARIIKNPSPIATNWVWDALRQAKVKGKISWIPWAVTRRLMAAAAPTMYTSVVYHNYYYPLWQWLHEEYGLHILDTDGDSWAEKDSAMRVALVTQGLPDTDPYLLNTFVWELAYKIAPRPRKDGQISQPGSQDNDERVVTKDIPLPPTLNTIYYGPPGTGKTHALCAMRDAHFVTRTESMTKEQWEESLVKEVVWREVIVAALSDLSGHATVPQIRKHPLVDAKFRCMGGKQASKARIWGNLQTHSPQDSPTVNYSAKREPALFDKDDDGISTWRLLSEWEEDAPGAAELLHRFRKGKPAKEGHEKRRYATITFHQSYSYEEFVEGIRPVLADEEPEGEEETDNLSYRLHDGVFKKICTAARADPDHPYALLIDEINRGNISKIFGELITLMENSKRANAAETMEVLLPYSGKPFSIPRNLYIIGTMNTADRSLALMDTALRRRFAFERVDPDPSLLAEKEVEGVRLDLLLETINERIEALYDKEHAIGHSYLWDVADRESLRFAFQNQILPLLEEYFFEDWEKIRLVLGDNQKATRDLGKYCFLTKEDRSERLFGTNAGLAQPAPRWKYNTEAMLDPKAYIAIYDPAAVAEKG